jgi:hypothetical protein
LEWVDNQTLITTGFDSGAKRQFGVWDLRNMEQPLILGPLSEGSGIPFFYYDREYNIMLVAGRGDNVISYFHLDRATQQILTPIGQNLFTDSTQKAFGVAPKHCVNVGK